MARASKDFAVVLADLPAKLPNLRWSDLFRSYEMQKQANLDFLQGRKKAFSPPPGGSLHEAGRAMDIDLSTIGMGLAKFWALLLQAINRRHFLRYVPGIGLLPHSSAVPIHISSWAM